MSKLSDRLTNLGQAVPQKMGFGQVREKKRNPVVLIVGVVESNGKTGPAGEFADIFLLRSKKGGKPATVKPDREGLWGVAISDCTVGDLASLKEAGCDFILIESESASGAALRDDGLGRGFVVPDGVTENRAHAIDDLPLDYLLLRGLSSKWPVTVGGALDLQEKVSMFTKHIFLEINAAPSKEDLELLRDMPVSALVVDLGVQDAQELQALKKAISELEPRKQRSELVAVLPANMQSSSTAHSHDPEPDHQDDDDDES
ncbi:MAG: hypothetical protein EXR44_06370 [Dehalococcoidia bacterium]|nr:hypothetical protein [Dehalococcoidia bacterium]